jgi:glycosyltransferase involved in cell wall biosynthesis
MRLLLVADTYPPARISGALQMRDLALELARQGHAPVVLTPTSEPGPRLRLEQGEGVQVLRVRAPRTKDVPLVRRALAELALPWFLLRGLRKSVLANEHWDGVAWYSPTIFLGPLVRALKRRDRCRAYLIVRDLFPDWAVDAGMMRRGLAYRFFKAVERFQYRQADAIGVQTPSNAPLVAKDAPAGARIEVLHNWLDAPPIPAGDEGEPSLQRLAGRTIFVYAGNMGVAQDMDGFVELARRMRDRKDAGFLFIGRGSEAARLKSLSQSGEFDNLLVLGEIDPSLLPALLARCHVGIVALHPAHHTHNIPGKLLTYLHARLPVLARVNADNDLVGLIRREGVGLAVAGDDHGLLHAHALRLLDDAGLRARMGEAGARLGREAFSSFAAARQIVARLSEP